MRISLFILMLLTQTVSFSQKNCTTSYASVHKIYNSFLLDSIKSLKFETKHKRKHIPSLIKKNLKCWENGRFRIADQDKPYNATDTPIRNWPRRRINYLGLNKSYMILSYAHGGYGHHWHTLIFRVNNGRIEAIYNLNLLIRSFEDLLAHLNSNNPIQDYDARRVPEL